MRFNIGANPFKSNLTPHFHETTLARFSAVQLTPRNGRHDDAPNNLFDIGTGSAGHRLALSVHE